MSFFPVYSGFGCPPNTLSSFLCYIYIFVKMLINEHQRCLPSRYLILHGTYAFETFIQRYLFPIEFLFGLIGNSINLCVLLGAGMRNKANDLLAAMAFADSLFLITLLPHSLASFSLFAENYNFRRFYLVYKHHFTACANWFSAAAIWLVQDEKCNFRFPS